MKSHLLLLTLLIAAFGNQPSGKSTISKDFLLGRYNYRTDTSFIRVPAAYSQSTVYLKKETYHAFLKMRQAAAKDGITLDIISGTRSFYDQVSKWDTKWYNSEFAGIRNQQQKVISLLRWWSMPGTSRHHWGTEVDLTNMKLSFYKNKAGIKMYNWMVLHAHEYGFRQPFTANRPTGYQEEKWHWSYVPLSKTYLREYVRTITYADITGCHGSSVAANIGLIKNWVEAVNPECK
jgi:D-alanyl-D-alanine carboxypeptidase